MILIDWVKEQLHAAYGQAFANLPEFQDFKPDIVVTPSTQSQYGHYQCNSALKWSKRFNLPPKVIAERWVQALQNLNENPALKRFSEAVVAGPGFINLRLSPEYISEICSNLIGDSRLGLPKLAAPGRVVVDFSSPNIAKEMHVGHLRSTIIGDALARILEFVGYEVLRLNHVGDWGTQFGMLIAYIRQEHPELLDQAHQIDLPRLMQWYQKAKRRFDEEASFKLLAQQAVVALQGNEPQALEIWQKLCLISRKGYQQIYDLLDIKIEERGESFYNPWLAEVVQSLESQGLTTLSEGALCLEVPGFINREGKPLPLIIKKSDGGFNYATTDLTALKHRVEKERGAWLIYVVDAGQSLHLQMVFAAARLAKFTKPDVRLDHVSFGLVLGPDGKKFRTRSGETEKLLDLITAAVDKALSLLQVRNPDASIDDLRHQAEILGINAIKYADLSCNRLQDYAFSYEKMLRFEGNTAAFLLYAYVRVQSIKRKVGSNAPLGLELNLSEAPEIELALKICQFPETLMNCLEDLLPHRLCDYLYQLSEKFHHFFHSCRVEGSPQQQSRLKLIEGVAEVMGQGLQLLGLRLLDRM